MPFGLQPIHLIVIAVVALLIFGPSRLPEIGRGVGRAITEFRRGAKEMTNTFMEEVKEPDVDQPAGSQAAVPGGNMPVTGNFAPPNGAQPAEVQPAVAATATAESAASNFCIHCGKANPVGAVYCNQCGQKIAE